MTVMYSILPSFSQDISLAQSRKELEGKMESDTDWLEGVTAAPFSHLKDHF